MEIDNMPSINKIDKNDTVRIGKQNWLAHNLNVSNYRNGNPIMYAQSNQEWIEYNRRGIGAYRHYNDNIEYGQQCGKLYNWFAVNDIRGLSPKNFHIPTDKEWSNLVFYLGGNIYGAKLKDCKSNIWELPNTGANDKFGFSVLPCGYCSNEGFFTFGYNAYFWTASEYLKTYAWLRYFCFQNSEIDRGFDYKTSGFSIRCISNI